MDCRTAREMSSRLLEWDLSAGEQADLQLHLAVCPDCREELDSCFALHRTLVRARENPAEPPRDLALHIMREVNAASPLPLMMHRSKAGFIRRLEEITLVFKTPGRMRTAFSAGAVALVALVAVGSLYLNNPVAPTSLAVRPTTPVTTPTTPTVPTKPTKSHTSQPPAITPAAPATPTELASASTGTMTSVWVDAKDLDALNRELGTVAGQHNADYQVYSLNNAPGGQNKEIVRITAGTTGVTDRILSTAAAVGRVVNTVTTTGSNGQDVITAFVSGPGQ